MRRTLLCLCFCAAISLAQDRPTMSSVLQSSSAEDWRTPAQENLLYLQLDSGRVVFEMAPRFAPGHVENIRRLATAGYFDGLAIVRSQENYVAQWGDPNSGSESAKSLGNAAEMLDPEFFRSAGNLPFRQIDSQDAYADEVGFSNGFPVGRDAGEDRAWLTHCFGMLGVGRAESPRSGNGAELYVVTGHAPRHLDRNVTLVGRVIDGIEHLTTLPRGTGPLGFYETPAEQAPIRSVRFGTELPEAEQLMIELFRTDTDAFDDLVEARRHRAEEWFVDPTDRVGVCNVPLPSRFP